MPAVLDHNQAADVAVVDPFLADLHQFSDSSDDEVPPVESTDPAVPATPAVPEPEPVIVPAAEPPKHSPEMVSRAMERFDISAAEIEQMSATELNRMVNHLDRFGQKVWNIATTTKEVEAPKAEVIYDLEKNEKGYDPEIVDAMRGAREARAEAKSLKEKLERLERTNQQVSAQSVNQRIDSLISEKALTEFDRTTAKGAENFSELLYTMQGIQSAATAMKKTYSEKEIFTRAVNAMGMVKAEPAKPTEDEIKLAGKKKEWEEAALAKPTNRGGDSAVEKVTKILREARKNEVSEPAEQVDWLP